MNSEELKFIIDDFNHIKEKYEVWIVANVSNTVQNREDFIKHADFSEFFTKAEFASIVSAISGIFGYTRVFYSELELIKYILDNKSILDVNHILVYNFARDGILEGKKSLIPALCDLFQLKYIGSNPFVVSLLRNKFIYTKFLESMNIPVPHTSMHNQGDEFIFNSPVDFNSYIVKNIYESASIGLSSKNIINSNKNNIHLLAILHEEMKTDKLLLQEYINGKECEVFVIKYENIYYAFPPVEICINNSDILTQELSNSYDYTFLPLMNKLSKNICDNIILSAQKSAELLNIKNYARFDYRVKENGSFYLIDIAGSPYVTRHSSITYLFEKVLNLSYSDIFSLIGAITVKNQN